MDSIDLDPPPILGMGSDIYKILNRFRMDLGGIFRHESRLRFEFNWKQVNSDQLMIPSASQGWDHQVYEENFSGSGGGTLSAPFLA